MLKNLPLLHQKNCRWPVCFAPIQRSSLLLIGLFRFILYFLAYCFLKVHRRHPEYGIWYLAHIYICIMLTSTCFRWVRRRELFGSHGIGQRAALTSADLMCLSALLLTARDSWRPTRTRGWWCPTWWWPGWASGSPSARAPRCGSTTPRPWSTCRTSTSPHPCITHCLVGQAELLCVVKVIVIVTIGFLLLSLLLFQHNRAIIEIILNDLVRTSMKVQCLIFLVPASHLLTKV